MRVHFLLVGVIGAFHTRDHISLKRIAFIDEFGHAFRIGDFGSRKSLEITRLAFDWW